MDAMYSPYKMRGKRKENIYFNKSIDPMTGDEYSRLEEMIKGYGHIVSGRVKFAKGQGGLLRLRPVVRMENQGEKNLLTYPSGGNAFISGEDQEIILDLDIYVEYGDILRLYYYNTADYTPYTIDMSITIYYDTVAAVPFGGAY